MRNSYASHGGTSSAEREPTECRWWWRVNPHMGRHASAGGKAKARRQLTLERVEEEFGRLETPQDAKRRLALLSTWTAAGMLPSSVAGSAVRAVEVWVKAFEADIATARGRSRADG